MLREFLNAQGVTASSIEDLSRSEGRMSITWRIASSEGSRLILKQHESIGLYQREVAFYRMVVPLIGKNSMWLVPELLASDDEHGIILITELPGRTFDSSWHDHLQARQLWEIAGAFARRLHGVPTGELGDLPRRLYCAEKINTILSLAQPHIPTETMVRVEKTLLAENRWDGLEPVPVHADFTPRNWVVTAEARLGVIDWERSGIGYWIEDVQRLIVDYWHDEPGMKDAFLAGYGRDLTQYELLAACRMAIANATGGVPWAIARGDWKFVKQCELFLERALTQAEALL